MSPPRTRRWDTCSLAAGKRWQRRAAVAGHAGSGVSSRAMAVPTMLPASRTALAVIRKSGNVIVDAQLPASDLVVLATAAAQWGASMTVRNAHLCPEDALEEIAARTRARHVRPRGIGAGPRWKRCASSRPSWSPPSARGRVSSRMTTSSTTAPTGRSSSMCWRWTRSFPDNALKSRAITDPTLQKFAYWGIIATEWLMGIVCLRGAWRLWDTRNDRRAFIAAKDTAAVGLLLVWLLYYVGFVIVGGEWFSMWQSAIWNGQQAGRALPHLRDVRHGRAAVAGRGRLTGRARPGSSAAEISRSDAMLCTGRNSSTYGRMARMPAGRASNPA